MEGGDFALLVDRELGRLAAEVDAYADEAEIWTVRGGQKNSPGTLVLHLCGNLMHYIGEGIGGTGYVRDRDAEFSDQVTRADLQARIAGCKTVVTGVLSGLSTEDMDAVYPGDPPTRMKGTRTRPFLVHLVWHLGWHLGHIYYHRLGVEPELP